MQLPAAKSCLSIVVLALLAACTPPQTVEQSRDQLWAAYGNQPVDSVLMALGTPARESHLSDGSRMLTYQFASVYDSGSPFERRAGCEVTLLAKSPSFKLENIAMQGQPYECSVLASGRTGLVRHPYMPPQNPYMYGSRVHPFYRYGF